MRERPILFSAPMVRAILAGTKTQTRRAVKPQPLRMQRPDAEGYALADFSDCANSLFDHEHILCPYGRPCDRLWVKETIRLWPDQPPDDGAGSVVSFYPADGSLTVADAWPWKRPQLNSIHCPRRLSRIDLDVTGVRVERLNDISEADAVAEGVQQCEGGAMDYLADDYAQGYSPTSSFRSLWESISGPGSWDANPWVWVVDFRRLAPHRSHEDGP